MIHFKQLDHVAFSGSFSTLRKMNTHITALTAAFVACVLFALSAAASGQESRTVSLLSDTHFRRGVRVCDPKPGKHLFRGELCPWPDAEKPPLWSLCQWTSRFSLAGAKSQKLPSGAVRYSDETKSVIFGPSGSDYADLTLAIDSTKEYEGGTRKAGEPWPHLLVERELAATPPLDTISSLKFQIRYRLLKSVPNKQTIWNDSLHTAHFVLYIAMQNRNTSSPGFGDYLWFGFALYDLRYEFPPQYAAKDVATDKIHATNKFIFTVDFKDVCKTSSHGGDWVAIDTDLLPQVHKALRVAWERGFLKDSRELSDYQPFFMNMGWEMPGPVDAALQVRDLKLEAVVEKPQ